MSTKNYKQGLSYLSAEDVVRNICKGEYVFLNGKLYPPLLIMGMSIRLIKEHVQAKEFFYAEEE